MDLIVKYFSHVQLNRQADRFPCLNTLYKNHVKPSGEVSVSGHNLNGTGLPKWDDVTCYACRYRLEVF